MREFVSEWGGVLAGPVVWLALLEINFATVPWACAAATKAPMLAATAVALALTAGAALLALRNWRAAGRDWPDEQAGIVHRHRFIAAGGVLMSGFFFLVILAQGITNFVLGVCE